MFKCEYCKKQFKRENSLAVHVCEKKRRALSKRSREVVAGYNAYNMWNKIAMGAKLDKTYEQFSSSNYYTSFVKFGSYVLSIRAIKPEHYIEWLTVNRVRLDSWCKDSTYNKYLIDYSKKESPDRAMERFILLADEWAATHDCQWQDFWTTAAPHVIVHYITMGKISPWILYGSDKAQAFIDTLPNEMLQEIANTLDPEYWHRKMKLHPADIKFIRNTIG